MIQHKDYLNWYYRTDVKFEIIKQLKYREFALLNPSWLVVNEPNLNKQSIRLLKCHSVQHFDYLFKRLGVATVRKFYQLYYSLAKYINGIPDQTMNLYKRDNEEWKKNHFKQMIQYDFLLDIDEENHKDIDYAFQSAKTIKHLFDKFNVPYELRFSGMGFHFIILSMFMPKVSFNPSDKNNIYFLYKNIAKRLNRKYTELIDFSIYDSRRICKLPYSLAIYQNDTYVCTPFHYNKQFNDFKLEDYNINNYIFYHIKNRGLHTFNREGNIKKMLKDLQIIIP